MPDRPHAAGARLRGRLRFIFASALSLGLASLAFAPDRVEAIARGPGTARVEVPPVERSVCDGRGNAIVVLGRARLLHLCADGREEARYPVALGRGGLGKFVVGDLRTPVGTYRLGRPSRSFQYYRRIPIEFPNDEQKATGYLDASGRRLEYSGFDLLIHGPSRALAGAGPQAVAEDWTEGCIALATDAQIDEVIAWYLARPGVLLHVIDEAAESGLGG